MLTNLELKKEVFKIKQSLSYTTKNIIKPAKGALKYDYLVPAGPYSEQWDWDAFFMGLALISENKENAIYLKNWALNYILNSEKDGKVAGCITDKGYDPRLQQIKPLLAQGVLIASQNLNDYEWFEGNWEQIKNIVNYRFKHFWIKKYGLGVWFDSMESGADNNPASLNYPNKSVISVDFNTFMYRECKAMYLLSQKLQKKQDAEFYSEKAKEIKNNMQKFLWSNDESIFWNLDIRDGSYIKCISYSSFLPLWKKGLLDKEKASLTIKKYLLNPDHLLSKYGIRTVSKQDKDYNNVNMIKPHSNWQGPIWPIANWLYIQGLLNYGFRIEAVDICLKIHNLLINDVEKTGGMHENYDAETGKALAAPDFISWNILFLNCLQDIIETENN